MKKCFLVLTFLLLSSVSWAADLKLPAQVVGDPDAPIIIRADTTCTIVKWIAMDPGLHLIPTDLLKDTKTAIAFAKAGTYSLWGYTSDANGPSDPQMTKVFVGVPPTPPGPPVPPTPVPTDAFFTALQKAYTADTDSNKAIYRDDMKNLYKMFDVTDPTLKTAADLLAGLLAARRKIPVSDTSFLTERQAIAVDLDSVLPAVTTTVLDQPTRDAARKEFDKVSQYLQLLK